MPPHLPCPQELHFLLDVPGFYKLPPLTASHGWTLSGNTHLFGSKCLHLLHPLHSVLEISGFG